MKAKIRNRNKLIPAKEIMRDYRLTYQTLNHYTDFGLLSVLLKIGNVRYYDRSVVKKRMSKINALREEGYSLNLIRKKLLKI